MSTRLLLPLACSVPLALGIAACGNKQSHPTSPPDANGSASTGFYVDAGPITYQVQISRELNPFSVEDREYVKGASATPPRQDEEWFAVFMWAKNQTHSDQTTTDSFDIVDTQGKTYYPVPLNPSVNPYTWTTQTLPPGRTEPQPDSTAYYGPTLGGEVLFKISTTAYANRPLTLEIHAAGQAKPSTVLLDL